MQNRACPFCGGNSKLFIGTRIDNWVRCRDCRSMFRDVSPERFRQIHGEAFQDHSFIESSTAVNGRDSAIALWDSLSLPGTSLLEIGPGAGYLLAAAQADERRITAVESSEVHQNFIRESLGIEEIYSDINDLPDSSKFDAVVAINVFEHVYDISEFLCSVENVLAPGGTFFLSTPNATSLEASVLKTWWSMCKVTDHVSFPSPKGMAMAAKSSGLQIDQIWTSGLPFEFPVSVLTAARDRFLASRYGVTDAASVAAQRNSPVPAGNGTLSYSAKTRLANFYHAAAPFDPTRQILSLFGRAASVKARLTRRFGDTEKYSGQHGGLAGTEYSGR